MMTTGRAARGNNERKKKGKALDKQPLRRQLLADSSTKIVVTGPDFVGTTTLLQELTRVGYKVDLLQDKPPPSQRQKFC
jgi:stage III sporulation protein SpoIIIAA